MFVGIRGKRPRAYTHKGDIMEWDTERQEWVRRPGHEFLYITAIVDVTMGREIARLSGRNELVLYNRCDRLTRSLSTSEPEHVFQMRLLNTRGKS